MLINLTQSIIIDSTKFKETLAVTISVPNSDHSKYVNGRCGIFREYYDNGIKDPNFESWLTPEPELISDECLDFRDLQRTFIINHSSLSNSDKYAFSYKYMIYTYNEFKHRVKIHDLLLTDTFERGWYVDINNVSVILPDYNFIEKIYNS